MNSIIKDTPLFNTYIEKLQLSINALNSDGLEQFEDVYARFTDAVKKIATEGVSPSLALPVIQHGDLADSGQLNTVLTQVKTDVDTLYKELVLMNQLLTIGFNQINNEHAAAIKKTKKVRSLLGDYGLFTNTYHDPHLYFTESFVNTDNIDSSTDFINTTIAAVDEVSGVAVLGYTGEDAQVYPVAEIKIDSGNGTAGNNWQLIPGDSVQKKLFNGEPKAMIDGSAETMFEYEKVEDGYLGSPALEIYNTLPPGKEPLQLSIICKLETPNIVNYISIYPNNFGTDKWINIADIATSLDGKNYLSIKEQIPVDGFIPDENYFTLGPKGSKYEGIGSFLFFPRSAQYIKIWLTQSSAYPIETADGIKARYAIGVRDIAIKGIKFAEKSELVSKVIETGEPLKKIALLAIQNPVFNNVLAKILHEISPDKGATWYPILAMHDKNPHPENNDYQLSPSSLDVGVPDINGVTRVPKVLNINTGDTGAITTEEEVTQLRWRIRLERNTAGFNESFHPYSKPLGRRYEKNALDGSDGAAQNSISIQSLSKPKNAVLHSTILPFSQLVSIAKIAPLPSSGETLIPFPINLTEEEICALVGGTSPTVQVLVGNERWFWATGNVFSDKTSSVFRVKGSSLVFGDNSYDSTKTPVNDETGYYTQRASGGKAPSAGADIYLRLDNVNPARVVSTKPLKLKLNFQSDMDINQTLVYTGKTEPEVSSLKEYPIPSGVSSFKVKAWENKAGMSAQGTMALLRASWVKTGIQLSSVSEGSWFILGVDKFTIRDANHSYLFFPRIYIDGATEFQISQNGQSVSVHDADLSTGWSAYLPESNEYEAYIDSTTGDINNAWAKDNITLRFGIQPGNRTPDGDPGHPYTIDYCGHTHTVIYYSVKVLEPLEARNTKVAGVEVFFSKPIPSGCSPKFASIDYDFPFIPPNRFHYSTAPDELGWYLFFDEGTFSVTPDSFTFTNTSLITQIDLEAEFPIVPGTLQSSSNAKEYFRQEVSYKNGYDEFYDWATNPHGWYSINYETGILYLPPQNPIPANTFTVEDDRILEFNTFQYNIITNWGVDLGENAKIGNKSVFSVTDQGMGKWAVKINTTLPISTSLGISWDEELTDPTPPSVLAPYFTPIVKDIAYVTSPVYKDDLPEAVTVEEYNHPTITSVTGTGDGDASRLLERAVLTITGTYFINLASMYIDWTFTNSAPHTTEETYNIDISGDPYGTTIILDSPTKPASWVSATIRIVDSSGTTVSYTIEN